MTEQWFVHVIGLALTVIGALILAVASLAWRTVLKIEQKQDLIIQSEAECRESLPRVYVSWEALLGSEGVLTDIKQDRRERWRDYDSHRHPEGPGNLTGPPIKG